MKQKMNKNFAGLVCPLSLFLLFAGNLDASEIFDFNPGWMFKHSDHQIAPREYKEHKSIWAGAKADTSDAVWEFTSLKFDENGYSPVNLPHDWSVEDGFYPEEDGE